MPEFMPAEVERVRLFKISGFPPEFIPHAMRDENNKLDCFIRKAMQSYRNDRSLATRSICWAGRGPGACTEVGKNQTFEVVTIWG